MRRDADITRLWQFTMLLAALWASAISISLYVICERESKEVVDRAAREARTALKKYSVFYAWSAEFGGAYVPASKGGSLREIRTKKVMENLISGEGEVYVHLDPSTIMKKIFMNEEQTGERHGRLVSVTPLNPENAADAWERKALEILSEKKANSYSDVQKINEEYYMRAMEPLIAEEECMGCHAKNGFKLGSITGGITTSVIFTPFSILKGANAKQFLFWHVFMMVGGLGVIFGGAVAMGARLRERSRIEGELSLSRNRFSAFMENLPGLAFIRDEKGRHIYANRRYEELKGYKFSNDGTSEPVLSEAVMKTDAFVTRGGLNVTIEEVGVLDGEKMSWLINKFPLKDDEKGETMVGGIGVEITNLNKAKEELLAKEQILSRLSRKLMLSHENERASLSREIHDEIGQKLTGIHLELLALEKKSDVSVERLMKIVREMDVSLRRIYNGLRPVTLDRLGLVPALKGLLADFSTKAPDISVDFRHEFEEDNLPDKNISLTIFRIVQELMTNVVKHADAKVVEIELIRNSKGVTLLFRDDGKGFSRVEESERERFGLVGISERALQHGGTVKIDSKPGMGTTVLAFFPIEPGTIGSER